MRIPKDGILGDFLGRPERAPRNGSKLGTPRNGSKIQILMVKRLILGFPRDGILGGFLGRPEREPRNGSKIQILVDKNLILG